MNSVRHLRMLTQYTTWANALLYESLTRESDATLSLDRPKRPGGILGVLGHIYVVGLIWKANLTEKKHGFTSRRLEESMSLNELRQRQADVDAWYVDFAESQTIEGLERDIEFMFVGGGGGLMSVSEMLLHVVNHCTYHRGYVADMLYESGSTPPTMDLPVYIRAVRGQASACA